MEKTAVITKSEMFDAIIETFKTGECSFDAETVIAFCEKEKALLASRASKAKERAAAKRAEGDALMDAVRGVLTSEFQTIQDIVAAIDDAEVTNAKVTARLSKMVEAGEVERTEVSVPATDKGRARRVKAFKLVG